MAQQPDRPNEPTVELDRYFLSAPCPGVEGKWSYFRPGWWMGNPRFTVFLNHPDYPKRDGIITAAFDPDSFEKVLTQLEELVAGTREEVEVEQHRPVKDGDGRATKDLYLDNTVRAKRDGNGIIAISVIKEGLPKVAFRFQPSVFHVFKDAEGNNFPPSELSNIKTLGFIDACRRMTNQQKLRLKPPYEPNAGKGGQKSGQTGGGRGKSDDMFDDVL